MIYIINRKGEMLEWLKRHAWKACKPLKGFRGFESRFLRKVLMIYYRRDFFFMGLINGILK